MSAKHGVHPIERRLRVALNVERRDAIRENDRHAEDCAAMIWARSGDLDDQPACTCGFDDRTAARGAR